MFSNTEDGLCLKKASKDEVGMFGDDLVTFLTFVFLGMMSVAQE